MLLQAAKGILEESKYKLEDEKAACENKMQCLQGRLEGKEEDMTKKQVAREMIYCPVMTQNLLPYTLMLMFKFVDKTWICIQAQ